MVGFREHVVVEQGEAEGHDPGRRERAGQDPGQVDTAGPQRRDLVVLGQPPERHEHGHEHRARHRQGHDVAQRQQEKLGDGTHRHSPVHNQVQVVEQDVHFENERHDPEPEKEWNQVEPENVPIQNAHESAAYSRWRGRREGNWAVKALTIESWLPRVRVVVPAAGPLGVPGNPC